MSMRRQPLVTGEIYHVYNRGVDKRDIFLDQKDIYRFIESIKEFNRIDKIISLANQRKLSKIAARPLKREEDKDLLVEIVGYCLNPNHFHFIMRQVSDNGISRFMHKLQGAYSNYFNIKNTRSGSLFQGKFKSQLITSDNYFNKLIGYVNKNYLIHNIPQNKSQLVFSGDYEYENNKFNLISKKEAVIILESFGGINKFKKHCDEIVSIIRQERGEKSLLEDENLNVIIESLPDSGKAAI